MRPSLSPARLIAAAAFLHIATAVAAFAQGAPRLPDMTSYDCAVVSSGKTVASRHIGQVIKGRYHEWHEYVLGSGSDEKLGCIALMRPDPKQLTAGEARSFLLDSFAVGAPTASTAERGEAGAQQDVVEPENVQPEPIKRVRKLPPGTERPRDIAPDLPPVPATKSFDTPETGAPALPARERQGLLESPAADRESPAVVGAEDREQIPNTQIHPWNTIAYISVTYPAGTNFRCSGVLVSAYVVLTAGHCLHNNDRGGYVASARVYPGQTQLVPTDNTPVRPYGVKSDVMFLQTTAQWVQISGEASYFINEYRHDLGAIEFRTPFTHTSTFMPVLYGSATSPVTSAGYPAKVGNNTTYGLYADTGNETLDSFEDYRSNHVREFAIDASGGNSGGPFFYVAPSTGQRYLVGILSYAGDLDDYGGGPWYDSWNQSLVSGWASWTPGTAASGSVAGLRVASVFGSQQPSLLSFLRFYNAGTTAGTVEVTLADSATGSVLATWSSPALHPRSSRQFSLADIENEASGTFTKPMAYSISVRSTFAGTFQNAIFRKADATLSNISTCSGQASDGATLINVHSSLLNSGYPSAIVIHNTGSSAVQVPLSVYSGQTGTLRGTYTTPSIPANGQLVMGISTVENGGGFIPAGDYHYNIRATGTFTGYMQHLVNNMAAGITTDMSTSCALVQQ